VIRKIRVCFINFNFCIGAKVVNNSYITKKFYKINKNRCSIPSTSTFIQKQAAHLLEVSGLFFFDSSTFILQPSSFSHQPSAFSHQNGPYPIQLVVLMAVIIDEMMLARICKIVFQVSFFIVFIFLVVSGKR